MHSSTNPIAQSALANFDQFQWSQGVQRLGLVEVAQHEDERPVREPRVELGDPPRQRRALTVPVRPQLHQPLHDLVLGEARLDPQVALADKDQRVKNYASNLQHEVEVIAHSCGVTEPRLLRRHHAQMISEQGIPRALSEIYPVQQAPG